jgi:hypothetical protein
MLDDVTHRDFTDARICGIEDLDEALTVAEKVNDDGYATGLQPIEIRHLFGLVQAERKATVRTFAKMPYLAGSFSMQWTPLKQAQVAVDVITDIAARHEDERQLHRSLQHDLAAFRRVLGIEGGS